MGQGQKGPGGTLTPQGLRYTGSELERALEGVVAGLSKQLSEKCEK